MRNKKLKKLLATTLATSVISLNYTIISNALTFSDVKDNYWAKSIIEEFVNKGYIGGYSDNTFKPDKSITRAEFITIVNNVFGYKTPGDENFTDVKSGQWYYKDVCIAMKEGYINGYEDKTFRPNKEITREEVAVIITNIKDNKDINYDKINTFDDGHTVSKWAKSSVEGAIEEKYISGYSNNTIRPKANITRAESVATLSRIPVQQQETIKIMYTTGDPIVNVRKGPGTSYEKLGTLPKGSKVEVVKEANGWAKIKYNNGYAYVSMNYLTTGQGQTPLPEVPATPTYVDSPQNKDIISSSQDVYQSKIDFEMKKGNNGLPNGISLKNTGQEFKVNYTVYSNSNEIKSADGSLAQVQNDNPIEAIKISLENAPKNYHIFYRTKLKGQGWQAWEKDNIISGQIGNDSVVEDIQVRLVVSDKANTMVKPKIAVDIGHNVPRPIIRGSINGIYKEDDLTKAVGEKVIYKLRGKGYNVVNTLPKGRYTQSDELKYRSNIANKNEADKFVSIHFNTMGDPGANGTEVYYSEEAGASTMANKILTNIVKDFGFTNRGTKLQGDLYVLQNTNMPGVLVETCFLTNQNDMDKLISKGEQTYDILADAIVNGIIN